MLVYFLAACQGASLETTTPGSSGAATATASGQTALPATPGEPRPNDESTPPAVSSPPPVTAPDFYYGLIQPVATADEIRSPEIVAQAMREIKDLGGNMVLQLFMPELPPEAWKSYLDAAQQEGMLVVGRIGPSDWNPDPADLSPILDVLAVVADHPALYGFVYLHEPWEVFTTAQMQAMYREIKAAHPDLRLGVIWSGEIERSVRRPDPRREYTDDLCDLCIVNLKAFQNDPAGGYEDGLRRMQNSAPVIQEVTPDAELWSSVQVWAPPEDQENRRGFRVPSPEEMEELFCTLKPTYPLHGFLWASWELDLLNVETLADPGLAEQRQAVRDVYETCVASDG